METKVSDFNSIILRIASPDRIKSWSYGEVTKPETINYRTQRPEKDGLFDERIFGPEKDYECYCGKYRRIRYKGIICDKCGVEVTRAIVRRERMGHIQLAVPVTHIWFVRGVPSRIGLLLDLSVADLERVVYFASYVITRVDEEKRAEVAAELEREFKIKSKQVTTKKEQHALKEALDVARNELASIQERRVLAESEYHHLSLRYGDVFQAGIGAEALHEICNRIDLDVLRDQLEEEVENASTQAQRKAVKRLSLVKALIRSNARPEWMFLSMLPVIPPDLRPMVQLDGGRNATSDVNDLYRRVINRNNRLKRLLDLHAPEVIVRNEKRMLQEAVDALIDNSIRRSGQQAAVSQAQKRPLKSLADILKGKQGRFRQNLLGKRVDYSGRSVIVVGPELKLHQCGLPKHMTLELFRPFVISRLIEQGFAHNIRGANRLIDEATPDVWAALEQVIKGKYVLLNRAPTLHRLGIQAFQPIMVEGNAIQVHPLVCEAFNADFDGDQMAVHVPLTEDAQWEAREIMASSRNLTKPGTGSPITTPRQDMVLGSYWLTKLRPGSLGEDGIFATPNEAILAYDMGAVGFQAKIKVRVTDTAKYREYQKLPGKILETSVGRLLFNSTLPSDFEYVNRELGRKDLTKMVSRIIERYGIDASAPILDKIKAFGFEYATRSGMSMGMDDFLSPGEKKEFVRKAEEEAKKISDAYIEGLLTEEERYRRVIEIWTDTKQKVDEFVPSALNEYGPVHSMVSSAARGNWAQVAQMTGMRGLVRNPAGRIIEFPITSNYKDGLTVLEYFISTHGARKGTADTALKTAAAGYLTRRLVDVAQDVIVREEDCGDSDGFLIRRHEVEEYGKHFSQRIYGRMLAQDLKDTKGSVVFKRGHIISSDDADLIGDNKDVAEIILRSPVSCKELRGLCGACYGYDLGTNIPVKLGQAVGIVAAQAIGEPGTQLTMRTFHTGGIVAAGDITLGLPRVEEIFEIRSPRHPAVISDVTGTVMDITIDGRDKIIKVLTDAEEKGKPAKGSAAGKKEKETREYIVPFGRLLVVEKGSEVKPGMPLSDGPIDIRELFRLADMWTVQNYILNEISKIYTLQGASINEKHVEVIMRQMFSRVRITKSGDSNLAEGDVVERATVFEANHQIKEIKGALVEHTPLVLGITRTALTTESFLAAASFQETARVLIAAAISGKEDKLRGLKENVIIGHLIPAGTGFRTKKGKEEPEE
ncbi:MAG: DNA-directed RNA polymerase subunit beta' [Candidatus Niyogibacteria bacterium CG10_big_fil_rev_8_21_14_0_10_46_36]|uniref:DNA-directed RNA polymerase subunit beta' n=1 Tax=Candidatus Niyogibacteria bacterium CG10_big_fil_rev_8_21_14_0_10_46_36 TaxID=1974726 RepID=A0A2H0TDT1_9BACT|nr:MAG: DNA-directed RNA polymerase subunit beta' [Candidatus Niyogibacteria bacterium CG10_big_fil_rev_8_21_14_0_10_46_36]